MGKNQADCPFENSFPHTGYARVHAKYSVIGRLAGWALVLASFFLATALSAQAVIHLKDGGTIKGKIESENPLAVTITNEFGSMEIERENIKRIVRQSTSTAAYNNSFYSFKKKSWTKFAIFGTLAGGIMTTALLADSETAAVPTWTAIGFGSAVLTFVALDFFIYGRVPRKQPRFGMYEHPLPPLALASPSPRTGRMVSPGTLGSQREEVFTGRWSTRF
jgi:hypothetical protein